MGRKVLALLLVASSVLALGHAARVVQPTAESTISAGRRNDDLTPEAAADQILSVPGFGNALPSNHFGGYITVDAARGRRLFYYFAESERDPANDPVVLWLNGGPGCSSFDGFIFEHGPFNFGLVPQPNGRGYGVQLTANRYGWNKVANMIFLDSPAGVGMSYSEHASDYAVDDGRTAADADAFLRGWFARFPQYQRNDFYVSGESYAGIYVPSLVRQVLLGNEAGSQPHINIVGYLVGNGCTDERYDGNAHPPFAAGKSLLPAAGFRQLEAACGGEYWNRTHGSLCSRLWNELSDNLAALNVYDTLQDCFHGGDGPAAEVAAAADSSGSRRAARSVSSASADPKPKRSGGASSGPLSASTIREAGLTGVWPLPGGVARQGPVLNWAHVNKRLGRLGLTPPCTDSRDCGGEGQAAAVAGLARPRPTLSHSPPCTDARVADLWLNDPRVREAIHAEPLSAIGPWTLCSDKISYMRTHGSMIPIHVNNTKGHGLRALIYSGDHDMAVPHTGSEAWIAELGFPVQRPWQPWYVADDQVAGYVVEYGHGLSYATVKGAGHMVPETNPREALALFKRFISREPLAE